MPVDPKHPARAASAPSISATTGSCPATSITAPRRTSCRTTAAASTGSSMRSTFATRTAGSQWATATAATFRTTGTSPTSTRSTTTSSARRGRQLPQPHLLGLRRRRRAATTASRTNGYRNLITIFDRLTAAGVSWKFYVQNYEPRLNYRTVRDFPGNRVVAGHLGAAARHRPLPRRPEAAKPHRRPRPVLPGLENGTLPAVAYIAPSGPSEHPPSSLASGQVFVRSLINALMRQPLLERARRSCSPTTTGAAGTTTSSRRRSTATATGSASPRSSSAPTRGVRSTTRSSTSRRFSASSRTTGD